MILEEPKSQIFTNSWRLTRIFSLNEKYMVRFQVAVSDSLAVDEAKAFEDLVHVALGLMV
jgi:hypothetical protein